MNSDEKTRKGREYLKSLARAFGGAIIFTIPILMTMEMWYLGFYMDRLRLSIFLFVLIPLLAGLSYKVGFRENYDFLSNALDAFSAYGVGFTASAVILLSFNIVDLKMSVDELLGKVTLQSFAGSIGAVMARGVLGGGKPKVRSPKKEVKYLGELFLMAAGALFLSLNLAPTEEMMLISFRATEWHVLGIMALSIVIMHSFVYSIQFRGSEEVPEGVPFWSIFMRYTLAGYVLVLGISYYILWTFGRIENLSFNHVLLSCVVLSFPGSVGAAAARLIV